jgi:hypothetical protein
MVQRKAMHCLLYDGKDRRPPAIPWQYFWKILNDAEGAQYEWESLGLGSEETIRVIFLVDSIDLPWI